MLISRSVSVKEALTILSSLLGLLNCGSLLGLLDTSLLSASATLSYSKLLSHSCLSLLGMVGRYSAVVVRKR
jgi:hypothetical protein